MQHKKCFACIVQKSNPHPASAVPVIATWRVIFAPYAIFGITMLPSRSTTVTNVESAASEKDWVWISFIVMYVTVVWN